MGSVSKLETLFSVRIDHLRVNDEVQGPFARNVFFSGVPQQLAGSLTGRRLAERDLKVAATVQTWQQARSCARRTERLYTSPLPSLSYAQEGSQSA